MNNTFVTDIVIVSSKDKCPAGYGIINMTTGGHDSDLYEGSIAKRGERYLCFAQLPGSNTVITELNIVKDKDAIPTGFTAVKNCRNDVSEKALRRHVFCMKSSSIQNTQSCVVNILTIKQSKGEVAPGNCYTISNDVNGLNICYQVMPVRQPQVPYPHYTNMPYRPPNVQSYPAQSVPYPSHTAYRMPGATNQTRLPSGNMTNTAAYRMPGATNQTRLPNVAAHQPVNKLTTAIQGIQFEVNPKFEMIWKNPNLSERSTKTTCSVDDIERKYGYTFEKEQNLLASR